MNYTVAAHSVYFSKRCIQKVYIVTHDNLQGNISKHSFTHHIHSFTHHIHSFTHHICRRTHLSRLTRRSHTHTKYNTSRRFDDSIFYLSSIFFYNNYTNTYYNTNI